MIFPAAMMYFSTLFALLTLINDHSNTYRFWFYCPATHVTSQVLQPKSVNKQHRWPRHTFISLYCIDIVASQETVKMFESS